jgi:hypothetical protein
MTPNVTKASDAYGVGMPPPTPQSAVSFRSAFPQTNQCGGFDNNNNDNMVAAPSYTFLSVTEEMSPLTSPTVDTSYNNSNSNYSYGPNQGTWSSNVVDFDSSTTATPVKYGGGSSEVLGRAY